MSNIISAVQDVQFNGVKTHHYPKILSDDALAFLVALHKRFNANRLELLEHRIAEQVYFDAGHYPSFPKETEDLRSKDWVAAPIPQDLMDRRVEITGPVDRKMVINALNSGAKTFMADFEDSNAPTFENVIQGQENLLEANLGTISLVDVKRGKTYKLNKETAVLLVRPRGLHLNEKHVLVNGQEMSGSLVDFGLYIFHNTTNLLY